MSIKAGKRADMLCAKTYTMSFAIIGDTHVKPESGDHSAPWKVNELATARARWIAREIERYQPHFIVHLGDLVHPVPELSTFGEAVALTRSILAGFHNRLHIIPGNHDIGDKPNKAMPAKMVRDEWIALHEKTFGPSFYSFDRDDIRFVFLNNPVLNSGSAIEAEQYRWLAETLASAAGRRLMMFMHYPLFLLDPQEPGHYDNIDEPARSKLLALIREHQVEAVFAGHVHNIFYHRLDGTEFYVMPATSFVRQDYAEIFRTDAVHENGRNDSEKLGFAIVEVHAHGHAVHYLRSYGETLAKDAPPNDLEERSASVSLPHPKKPGGTPFGVFLRHAWAEITALPYNGPMDEFLRKEARNDYGVASLWRLGIRDLRVPLGDLLHAQTRARMRDLVAIGHRFTVFALGIPEGTVLDQTRDHSDLIDRFECVLPADVLRQEAKALARFRAALGRPVLLSQIATSARDKKIGSRIELFVSHGFRPDQLVDVEALLNETRFSGIDHVVARVDLGHDLTAIAPELLGWQKRTGCKLDVHLRVAANNPATNVTDDSVVLRGAVELFCVALAYPDLTFFIDTFMDVDRGYFVRHGLIDRRCNLRPAGTAVEGLVAHLGAITGPVAVRKRIVAEGYVLEVTHRDIAAMIVLPNTGAEIKIQDDAIVALELDRTVTRSIRLDEPWTIQRTEGAEERGDLAIRTARPLLLIGPRWSMMSRTA